MLCVANQLYIHYTDDCRNVNFTTRFTLHMMLWRLWNHCAQWQGWRGPIIHLVWRPSKINIQFVYIGGYFCRCLFEEAGRPVIAYRSRFTHLVSANKRGQNTDWLARYLRGHWEWAIITTWWGQLESKGKIQTEYSIGLKTLVQFNTSCTNA